MSDDLKALRASFAEYQALKQILAEFEDPDGRPRDPSDPLVSSQSIRTKIIDGFVEGWGPAAPRVSPQLKARYPDIDDEAFWRIADVALPNTALSVQRLYSIFLSAKYVVEAEIRGDIVECGVFKGGAAVMLAESFAHFGDTTRRMFLFDTFDGWPRPTADDVDFLGQHHLELYDADASAQAGGGRASQPSVYRLGDFFERTKRAVLGGTRYPADKIHFVKGLVEHTLPHPEVGSLSLLRLDTDYYESTAWELKLLWPRLNVGGVMLIDDYGQFHGARKAVDEYFRNERIPVLLHRDDVTGRSMVKLR